jgi:hypothetical protein
VIYVKALKVAGMALVNMKMGWTNLDSNPGKGK